jgi:hypothetical protein
MNKGDKTVYQYESFEPTLDPSYISLDNTFNVKISTTNRTAQNLIATD